MDITVKTPKRWRRRLLGALAAVLALLLALVIAVFALWHNEIFSLASMKLIRERDDGHLDGAVYLMDVKGGFYLDEFKAQGGASSDAELIAFITGHITKGLIPMRISESEIACSSFTAGTQEGDRLFARNYDFAKTNTCIVRTQANEGRHASISTVDLQFLGLDVEKNVEGLANRITCLAVPYIPLDGINDAGVACGIYMTYQGGDSVPTDQRTDRPDITSTTLLRLILDYAGSVEEAVEIAAGYDLHDSATTSYHHMVADATGRSAILEWVGRTNGADTDGTKRELVVTYNDGDGSIGELEAASGFQWVTNFILQPGYYETDGEKKGLDRYQRIGEELTRCGGVVADEQAAMDILSIVGRRSWNNDDDNGCTVHSAVYNLTDKSVLWVPNEHYGEDGALFRFALEP